MGFNYYKVVCGGIVLSLLLFMGVSNPVSAQSSTASISQGFQTTDKEVSVGSIVSLESNSTARVQLSNLERVDRLAGVVSDKPLVSLSTGSNEIQVVIGGVTPVLVSTINGDIKTGDKITASPINGIGMKATSSGQVVGTAQEDLTSVETRSVTITDRQQQPQTVKVGTVSAQINIAYNAAQDEATSFVPLFLQQLANSVAGREVSALRIVICLLLLLMGFVGAGILLYSSVQSSIVSIGRNPLSEGAVRKSLLRVGVVALAVLLATVGAAYVVLAA
jgi:hypothetical protein